MPNTYVGFYKRIQRNSTYDYEFIIGVFCWPSFASTGNIRGNFISPVLSIEACPSGPAVDSQ